MKHTKKYIYEQVAEHLLSINDAKKMLLELDDRNISDDKNKSEIAIIGISGRFAESNNVDEYWDCILNAKNCIRQVPDNRKKDIMQFISTSSDLEYDENIGYNCGGFLDEIDKFDAKFFNISPKEAELMDPLHRLFLEVAWESIEDSGYAGDKIRGSKTGVYVGRDHTFESPYKKILETNPLSLTGSWTGILTSRLAYLLDLKGPNLVIDCACSSGLVAVHTACKALNNSECDMAIAGGVNIEYGLIQTESQMDMVESSSNSVKAFDKNADGTVWGEGIGVVLLKRLDKAIRDKDNIYAVIKGSAVNNDGLSNGLTAPNPDSQTSVMLQAWESAKINPETISYIETHGTGTKLGDPIEIKSISNAFKNYTNKKQFCALGSVKTNIGHTVGAAGMASLIKVVLSLRNNVIPPTINFNIPNPFIKFTKSPIYIVDKAIDWPDSVNPKRAGINAFGFSGTNCHLVIEEAPIQKLTSDQTEDFNILALSAKSKISLINLIKKYKIKLNSNKLYNIINLCYTANTGREHYSYRLAIVCNNLDDLKEKLNILNIDNINMPDIYYGEVENLHDFSNQGEEIYTRIKQVKNEQKKDILKLLCELYIKGENINWNNIFTEPKSKITLPTYCFEKKRYWYDINKTDYYYTPVWKEFQKPFDTRFIKRHYYIIVDNTDRYRRLESSLKKLGMSVTILKMSHFDYESFAMELANYSNVDEIKIVYTPEVEHNLLLQSEQDFSTQLNKGIIGLLDLIKAIDTCFKNKYVNLEIITKYANKISSDDKINPHYSAMTALGKAIDQENPFIKVRSIDTDNSDCYDSIASLIVSDWDNYSFVVRNNIIYTEILSHLAIDDLVQDSIEIKNNGVYIITGGLGGLGLEMGKYLAKKNKVRICLLGRSEFDINEKLITEKDKRSNTINEIRKMGSEIYYYQTDITNAESLGDTLNEIRSLYSGIDGIIHCAGLHGSGSIVNKPKKEFIEILQPKYTGTWLLDQYTSNDNLDFFIMFSSIAAVFGFPGQGDYAAANAFMNAYAYYRSETRGKTLAINWSTWKETGMALKLEGNVDGLFKVLTTEQALDLFDQIFNKNIKNVIIGSLVYSHIMLSPDYNLTIGLSEKIKRLINTNKIKSKTNTDIDLPNNIDITGKEGDEYTLYEGDIARIWAKVLGSNEIDVNANFRELGGDSILAINLYKEINKIYPETMNVTDIYAYSTVSKMAEYIGNKNKKDDEKIEIKEHKLNIRNDSNDDIAIIGMACRFSGADNINEYWSNLRSNKCSIGGFPEKRLDQIKGFIPDFDKNAEEAASYKAGYLESIDKFDSDFFRISPKEIRSMDPFQRLFLEITNDAIEDSGYGGKRLDNTQTGTYVGVDTINKPQFTAMINEANVFALTGSETGMIASRIAYILNLKGPSIAIDTACSSGLVAVHMACMAIKAGECNMAIAGGVNIIILPPKDGGIAAIESNTGEVRTFDNNAEGTVWGEGAGAIVLKPLSKAIDDGDNIYAIIKGSAVNSDGASNGIGAPNPEAQTDVILQAWNRANIDPASISYIEAHGTGTKLGDPIEIQGLANAFRKYTDMKQFCGIGSVKTNIGHTVGASGLASIIKVALAMKNSEIPASLNFFEPNDHMNIHESPLFINNKLRKWQGSKIAGVSAFGLSGTNCHLVMEEAPYINGHNYLYNNVLTLSSKNKVQLKELINQYYKFLNIQSNNNIGDICYTANTGRGHYEYRIAIITKNIKDLILKLELLRNINSFDDLGYNDIFYGYHSLVHSNESEKVEEITKFDKAKFTQKANNIIKKWNVIKKDDTLSDLCIQYVKGADVYWNELYIGQKMMKVSIPTYVYDKRSYWPEKKQITTHDNNEIYSNDEIALNKFIDAEVIIDDNIYSYREELVKIWKTAFEKEDISINQNFNDLGGDSIIAIEILRELNRKFGKEIDITDIYLYPTIAELSEVILNSKSNNNIETTNNIDKDKSMDQIISNLASGKVSLDETMNALNSLLED